MIDEFTYPERVQAALDFVENETKADRRRQADEQRWQREDAQYEREVRSRQAQADREAASDEKFRAFRHKQKAAQQAKRRFQPAQPEGWTR